MTSKKKSQPDPVAELGQKIAEKLASRPRFYKKGHPGNRKNLIPFKPGSGGGNPSGQRKDGLPKKKRAYKVSESLLEILNDKRVSQLLAQALVDVGMDKNHPLMIRAQEIILDRSEGKVTQPINHGGDVKPPALLVIGATAEEMKAIEQFSNAGSEKPAVSGEPAIDVEGEVVGGPG